MNATQTHVAMPHGEYHSRPELSSSGLVKFMRSPAHYQAYLRESKDTPALRLGRLIHTAVLEPDKFSLAIEPEGNKNSKAWKAQNEEFLRSISPQTEIVSANDYTTIIGVKNAVMSHSYAPRLLTQGKPEVSLFWTDKQSGVDCRCRPDWLWDDGEIVVDLKTTKDASPKGFPREIANYHYHLKAAFYLMGMEHCGYKTQWFIFIAVEKEPPYGVGIYELGYTALDLSMRKVQNALFNFRKCHSANYWPCYPEKPIKIELPYWEQKRLDEELQEEVA